LKLTERAHQTFIGTRRVQVLCHHLSPLFPEAARVLDVGCGDGALAARIRNARSDVDVSGIDVLVRPETAIPVATFDGRKLPYADRSFDATLLVNVLHHADDPEALLAEAARVSSRWVILADHVLRGPLSRLLLRFMDDVGNRRFGVALPYDYLSEARWHAAFEQLELSVETWIPRLGLYQPPLDWVFGGSLHFVARLAVGP
jgi:SAM-dependent methyltransferase